jgi:hypothetical protein
VVILVWTEPIQYRAFLAIQVRQVQAALAALLVLRANQVTADSQARVVRLAQGFRVILVSAVRADIQVTAGSLGQAVFKAGLALVVSEVRAASQVFQARQEQAVNLVTQVIVDGQATQA